MKGHKQKKPGTKLVPLQPPGLPVGRLRITRSNLQRTLLQHFQQTGQQLSFGKVCTDATVLTDSASQQQHVRLAFQVLPWGFCTCFWAVPVNVLCQIWCKLLFVKEKEKEKGNHKLKQTNLKAIVLALSGCHCSHIFCICSLAPKVAPACS